MSASILLELSALNADYWSRVDQRRDDPVDALYLESGILTAGSMTLDGRAAIREFFERRNVEQSQSGRRTRHVHTNLELVSESADRVLCRSTILVFAGVGDVPLASAPPSTIADVEDVCVRDAFGRWRFERRVLKPVFVGSGAASFTRNLTTSIGVPMASTPSLPRSYVACVPHVPLLTLQGREANRDLWEAYDARVDELRRFDPELVVAFGGDHYDNLFLKLSPQFVVGYIAEGVDDVGGRPGKLDVPIETAKAMATFLVEEGFDVATSHAMRIDHGFTNVLGNFLDSLEARPVVPIHINTIADPRPTLRRCRQLGAAIGRFAGTLGKRVAFLGSGGLSHQTDFIFPQYETAPDETMRTYIVHGDDQGTLTRDVWMRRIKDDMTDLSSRLLRGEFKAPWINRQWDEEFLRAVTSGDLTQLDGWTDRQVLDAAGYGGGEVRQWIAAVAAAEAAGSGKLVIDYYSPETTLAVGAGVIHSRLGGAA